MRSAQAELAEAREEENWLLSQISGVSGAIGAESFLSDVTQMAQPETFGRFPNGRSERMTWASRSRPKTCCTASSPGPGSALDGRRR